MAPDGGPCGRPGEPCSPDGIYGGADDSSNDISDGRGSLDDNLFNNDESTSNSSEDTEDNEDTGLDELGNYFEMRLHDDDDDELETFEDKPAFPLKGIRLSGNMDDDSLRTRGDTYYFS